MGEDSVNTVVLRGRVSGEPVDRELPSGDRIVSVRVVVPRTGSSQGTSTGRRQVTVDTFDCVARTGRTRRALGALQTGDEVEIQGALRRRFWRTGASTQSLVEVEVHRVRRQRHRPAERLSTAAQPGG